MRQGRVYTLPKTLLARCIRYNRKFEALEREYNRGRSR